MTGIKHELYDKRLQKPIVYRVNDLGQDIAMQEILTYKMGKCQIRFHKPNSTSIFLNSSENELNKAHTLQNKIGELQRELEGAAEREQDLQQQLEAQKELYKDFELLQQQYAYIQSEADELRNRIKDINNRDVLLQQKINRLTELESTIEISEYEKMDIRKSIEEIIIENEALAVKLQELQEKLNAEKYA